MESAPFILPAVQDAIDSMIGSAQHYIDVGRRDMEHIYSMTTQHHLATFGAMAESVGGKFSAYVGSRFVAGYYEGEDWISSQTVPRVQITIRLLQLDSFKDDKLVTLLEAIDSMGLKAETHDYTSSESPNRDFRFETDEYQLSVDAWVRSDSELCRRVKIGETIKTVVEEEWALQCD